MDSFALVSSSNVTAFLRFAFYAMNCLSSLHIGSMTFANLFWLSWKHFLGFLDLSKSYRQATYTCSRIPNNCTESIMYNASVQKAQSIVCLHDALKNCFQDFCKKKMHRSYILLLFRSFFLRCSGSMRFQLLKVRSRSSPRLSDLQVHVNLSELHECAICRPFLERRKAMISQACQRKTVLEMIL